MQKIKDILKHQAVRISSTMVVKITDCVEHLTIVSIVGVAMAAVGYYLFFQWLQYQHYLELRRYLPALLSVIGFMYAIYKTVPALEDFWGLKRSRINREHPFWVYAAIVMWLVFVNSVIIAFGRHFDSYAPFHMVLENFYYRFGNDAHHYIAIAQRWYENTADHRQTIVFFPFYAVLLRVMYVVSPNYWFAGWFVSNIFAFASGVMFYKLGRVISCEKQARLAVKFLFIFPAAFFLVVPMTESLFLFLSVAVIYFTIKERYVQVFIFGILATLTRSAGVLLVIPVMCELVHQVLDEYRAESKEEPVAFLKWFVGSQLWKFISVLAFPIGMGIYLMINYIVYGNAFEFLVIQDYVWHQSMYFFWNTITMYNANINYMWDWREWIIGLGIPGLVSIWIVLVWIIYGAKKIRPSLTLYAMAYFIFSFGATWLMSGPRYAAALFPMAFATAMLAGTRKWVNIVLTIVYLVAFALYFNEFIIDNFVF